MKTLLQKQILMMLVLLVAGGIGASFANTYTVTNTTDNTSTGSLRWAITQANANPGFDLGQRIAHHHGNRNHRRHYANKQ
jgi:hypothetical protein